MLEEAEKGTAKREDCIRINSLAVSEDSENLSDDV